MAAPTVLLRQGYGEFSGALQNLKAPEAQLPPPLILILILIWGDGCAVSDVHHGWGVGGTVLAFEPQGQAQAPSPSRFLQDLAGGDRSPFEAIS